MNSFLKSAFLPVAAMSILMATAPIVHAQDKDIVDIAAAAPNFKTLVAAVKAAGLVETLKSAGPFTVFAPTDEAFEKLEKKKPGILKTLLKPESKELLKSILLYHVVPGKLLAADVMKLKSGTKVKTASEKEFTLVFAKKGGVLLQGKNTVHVIKTDIEASNGVIHVLGDVLLPPDGKKHHGKMGHGKMNKMDKMEDKG